jgi:thioredoxin-like negative regulator of GroEL
MTWNNSATPKKAISDYLFSNAYSKYTINDHIDFLEFILLKNPENNDQKIELARLYIKDGQAENAQKLYKKIVFDDQIRDTKILEEAADFFELQGLYWDARKTRDLLNEVVQ